MNDSMFTSSSQTQSKIILVLKFIIKPHYMLPKLPSHSQTQICSKF
jgi:hypothetical protein